MKTLLESRLVNFDCFLSGLCCPAWCPQSLSHQSSQPQDIFLFVKGTVIYKLASVVFPWAVGGAGLCKLGVGGGLGPRAKLKLGSSMFFSF